MSLRFRRSRAERADERQGPSAWRFVRHLALRAVPFLLVILLGILGGLVYALYKTPVFTATAHVIVVPSSPGHDQTALNFAQAYGRLAAERQTLVWAVNPAVLGHGANARKHVRASTSPDTPLIQLTGSARSPERALDYANAAADPRGRYR
ncbi:MAG: hypothetical protein IRY90_01115, partial [Actinomadura rubrobrunea]|nr:hypothetical protein [Actinomadura rubrobrunea]